MTPAQKTNAALEHELAATKATLISIRDKIPMGYLMRHDTPGASGPTEKLDLAAAVKDYSEDRWVLIDRLSRAKTEKSALVEALVEAREQITILQDRLGIRDTGHGTLSIIDAALASIKGGQ